jgi:hypothetical protein
MGCNKIMWEPTRADKSAVGAMNRPLRLRRPWGYPDSFVKAYKWIQFGLLHTLDDIRWFSIFLSVKRNIFISETSYH